MAESYADQYAKSWCSKFDDEWYISLSLNERGLFDQLFTYAKRCGDTGTISLRSFRMAGEVFGCDGATASKILRKFDADAKVALHQKGGVITLQIRNYEKNQRLREAGASKKCRKPRDSSTTNQTRLDQTREEKIPGQKPSKKKREPKVEL